MKTNELTGPALDWAVAKCLNCEYVFIGVDAVFVLDSFGEDVTWQPSTNWAQGGPIIEREKISVIRNIGGSWRGSIRHTTSHPLVAHPVLDGWTNRHGETPLIAAMRCYVASKLGYEVDVPEELL